MVKPPPTAGSAGSRLVTLKRRPEFLRIRKGARWAGQAFVLEAKRRVAEDGAEVGADGPRFGFTITKPVGKAVERNRIRRRLKAAVQQVQAAHAKSDFDYVVVARRPALTWEYAALVSELAVALERVHRPGTTKPARKG